MAVPGFEPFSPHLGLSWLLVTVSLHVPAVRWLFRSGTAVFFLLFLLFEFVFLFCFPFSVFSSSDWGAQTPGWSHPWLFWLPLLPSPRGPPAPCAADQGVLPLLCLLKSLQAGEPRSNGEVGQV